MPSLDLLLLDLDGTLIGHTGEVRASLWPVLETLRARVPTLSVCTGRPPGGRASAIARRLGDTQTPHIFLGGALTCTMDGETIAAHEVPQDAVMAMIDHARQHDLTLEVYTPDGIFVDASTDFATRHADALGVSPQREVDLRALAATDPVLKTQWIVPHAHAKPLMEDPPTGCFAAVGLSDVMPDVTFITITRADIDKGRAATDLITQLGVSPDRVGAIGDSSGDLPMLEVVGHPFVMANAHDSLRQRFPTLPHVDKDGVRALLDWLDE